jgi:hypothetical protein
LSAAERGGSGVTGATLMAPFSTATGSSFGTGTGTAAASGARWQAAASRTTRARDKLKRADAMRECMREV